MILIKYGLVLRWKANDERRASCTHCSCREYKSAMSVWSWFKNWTWIHNTTMILSYIQQNFVLMRLCLWGRLLRFILGVGQCHKSTNFVLGILEKRVIYLPCWYGYAVFLILHTLRVCEPIRLACLLFQFFSNSGRFWIGMCWGQVTIHKYLSRDYISPFLLKHPVEGLMSILVRVSLSMKYNQNGTLKTNFGLGSQ